jgi:hypothetical protein
VSNVTPWLLFQSAQDAGGFGALWNSPQYALELDMLGEATAGPIGTVYPGQQTTTLRITQPLLGGALPGAFLLRGVEVEFTGRWSGGSTGVRTAPAHAVVGGAVRQSLGSIVLQVGTFTTVVKGGPTDALGFSAEDVLASGFGFQIYGTSSTSHASGNTLRIDSVRARFHWDSVAVEAPARGRGRSRAAVVAGICL